MRHTNSTPFATLFGQLVARAWRVFKARRQFAELQYWTDGQLKDIGLTRTDVRLALAQPFYSDPVSFLNIARPRPGSVPPMAANAPLEKRGLRLVEPCKPKNGKLAA